ncbi:response regulator transcription factor [Brevibacterium aurantiacum]|uniref:Response regulator transcription factor n=1 Tax=Brevibacterium aurantiacum TaxID=273384 RepID=A0A556CKE7_BREAU|nr:response regulator transcription factor [Brevibacterium aurantiacum]TSI17786.1 response regulator transcription factor [Brevibacterium aurantiacum]
MPRVLVVDDHSSVRAGTRAILATDSRIVVVGEAATAREAVEAVKQHAPDIVMLDLQLPDRDGIDVCLEVTEHTHARVLILTAFEIADNVTAALEAGAAGFLAKTAEPRHMIDAVHAVAAGDSYLTPSVTRHVIAHATGRTAGAEKPGPVGTSASSELTSREREIWILIGEGLTNRQIAQRLTISSATAKTHVSRILQKLGVSTRTQAAILALSDAPAP